jgi:hypothetical protein
MTSAKLIDTRKTEFVRMFLVFLYNSRKRKCFPIIIVQRNFFPLKLEGVSKNERMTVRLRSKRDYYLDEPLVGQSVRSCWT